jgi:hypothetical protein
MYTGIECALETGPHGLYIGVHPHGINILFSGRRPLATKKRRNNAAQ